MRDAASNKLALDVIRDVYPTSELREGDLDEYTRSLSAIIGAGQFYFEELRYAPETIEAAKAGLKAIEEERRRRAQMAVDAPDFTPGTQVVTNALQRGWPSAACAEPPVGTRGVVEGPAPHRPGMVQVRVHLRELGYECSDEDDEDDYRSFFLWAATLEPVCQDA